jgi:hypothetical protein
MVSEGMGSFSYIGLLFHYTVFGMRANINRKSDLESYLPSFGRN